MTRSKNKPLIYLADLRYQVPGTRFPLGIGFLATMLEKHHPGKFDIELFIESQDLEDAIKQRQPNLLGLANYSWNRNINIQFTNYIKSLSPQTVTLMGGPCFSPDDPKWISDFFARTPNLDFFISNTGEWRFVELVEMLEGAGWKVPLKHYQMVKGIFFRRDDTVIEGARVSEFSSKTHKEIDEIPSPYLKGLMDRFFDVPGLNPMIETVRGCPYTCTFCCWGSFSMNKVSMFSLERVKSELEYIVSRARLSNNLIFGDANFGILKRDIEVAQFLEQLREKTGWPQKIFLYFAKNSGPRVVEAASHLKNMLKVSMARQSMDDDVLKNTRRTNLDDESYGKILDSLGEKNIESMVELIYPLPGETRQSFVDGMDLIFKKIDPLRTEVRIYQTELLPGSEMATTEYRQKFGLKSGWRRLWDDAKESGDVRSCEYQEIVVTTDTFSMEDQLYVRKLHFYFSAFLTYRIYHNTLVFFVEQFPETGIMDFILKVDEQIKSSKLLSNLFSKFEADSRNEYYWFDYPPTVPDQSEAGQGDHKRLNIDYILKLIYGREGGYRESFGMVLREVLGNVMGLDADAVDRAVSKDEELFINYLGIAGEVKNSASYAVPAEFNQHLVVNSFVDTFNGDTVDTLYGLYSRFGGGRLDSMMIRGRVI
jgi:radical SAM superfamily enzyme YgiQ (UPF0313 family)